MDPTQFIECACDTPAKKEMQLFATKNTAAWVLLADMFQF